MQPSASAAGLETKGILQLPRVVATGFAVPRNGYFGSAQRPLEFAGLIYCRLSQAPDKDAQRVTLR